MKEIIYCQKCHNKKRHSSYESALNSIESSNDKLKVIDACTSSCGLGKKNYFAELDDELIVASTFDALLKKIEE